MTKYKYNKISTVRTFDESPSKWFLVGGEKVSRGGLEELPYNKLKKMIKNGKVFSIQRYN